MPVNAENESSKRKVDDRSSTSSADASFEKSQPSNKKATSAKSKTSNSNKSHENDNKQPKNTSFQNTKPVDQQSIMQQLNSLGAMVAGISEKMNSMITNTEFSNKFDQLVTKEFLENVIAGVKRELKEEMSEKMDKLESRIFELELKHDELLKENESLKKHVNENSTFINEVDNGVKHALQKTNDLEQYTRKSSVRIYGLDEDVPTTVFKVNKLLNEKLKMNIEEKEINIAHRLGKFESEKMRPVIVRFMSRQRKIETIKLRRALAKTQYVIKEDLTKDNQEFLNELNTVDNVETAWTNEGKFFAKLSPSGAILRVFHNTNLLNLRPTRNWRPKQKSYDMKSYPLSKATHCKPIIIPISRYPDKSEYNDSLDADVKALCDVFKQLHFAEPDLSLRNCDREQILSKTDGLLAMSENDDYTTNVDYLLCVIISYGVNNGCFRDRNEKDISIDELVHIFNAENCKGLRTKPKIFIVQTDDTYIHVIEVEEDFLIAEMMDDKIIKIPTQADVLVYHSNIPTHIEKKFDWADEPAEGDKPVEGTAKHWDSSKGSMFIQKFCEVLKCQPDMEIHKLTLEVNSRIKRYIDYINSRKLKKKNLELNKTLELPVCTSQLRNHFQF